MVCFDCSLLSHPFSKTGVYQLPSGIVIFSTTEPKDGQSSLGDQAELKAIHLSHRPGLDPNLSPPIKLYTVDAEVPAAMASYKRVQEAYRRIFQTIGIPFTFAKADIEAIGSATSHKLILPVVVRRRQVNPLYPMFEHLETGTSTIKPITAGRQPQPAANICPVQSFENDALPAFKLQWEQMEVLVDESCLAVEIEQIFERVNSQFRRCFSPPVQDSDGRLELSPLSIWPSLPTYTVHDLRTVSVALDSSTAIEVGHTFYLGTNYSDALVLRVGGDEGQAKQVVEMGCFGVGINDDANFDSCEQA
ncbi:hypothetical protein PtA15_18A79 [Puccinia triticina]|uniref:Uncharacterized protein n=1 Tax=Puccinia triticina TaxID=208348 RepID=A0ABY7D5T8_9BASI|nr:uncharacterized protein PtA15_18A79 [Puccinia triticina]WAQ93023.1 hypothetical protein PtA15_18A79 [Puccinia triticina]